MLRKNRGYFHYPLKNYPLYKGPGKTRAFHYPFKNYPFNYCISVTVPFISITLPFLSIPFITHTYVPKGCVFPLNFPSHHFNHWLVSKTSWPKRLKTLNQSVETMPTGMARKISFSPSPLGENAFGT